MSFLSPRPENCHFVSSLRCQLSHGPLFLQRTAWLLQGLCIGLLVVVERLHQQYETLGSDCLGLVSRRELGLSLRFRVLPRLDDWDFHTQQQLACSLCPSRVGRPVSAVAASAELVAACILILSLRGFTTSPTFHNGTINASSFISFFMVPPGTTCRREMALSRRRPPPRSLRVPSCG